MPARRRILQLVEQCKSIKQLKQVHGQMVTAGLREDSFALSRIMAFCADPQHGSINHARTLFQDIDRPTLCICNTMMKSLLLNGENTECVHIYRRMLHDGLRPDNYTLPYMLKACANLQDLKTGVAIHSHVVKLGYVSDTFVGNTLILLYMACGDTETSREVFDGNLQRDAASWTVMISGYSKIGKVEEASLLFDQAPVKDRGIWGSMISGYVQNNCFKEGLAMFRLMQAEGLDPDEGVFVSALAACAQLGAMDVGTWIHHYLNYTGLPLSVRLGTALVDMYLKCGSLELGRKIFDGMLKRDTICWNVMILGLAMHGDGDGALELFSSMQREGCRPDDVTFLALLTACSHSGMVERGLQMFNSIRTEYCIEPKSEHYGCMVDFLGRAGHFEDAQGIIERMPASTSASGKAIAWRALLSACWKYGETRLAEVAATHLLQLEEVHSGVYVLLSNIFDSLGNHYEARRMRRSMKDRGVHKAPGSSSIELVGHVHEFVAGEQSHPRMEEIYDVLDNLNSQL